MGKTIVILLNCDEKSCFVVFFHEWNKCKKSKIHLFTWKSKIWHLLFHRIWKNIILFCGPHKPLINQHNFSIAIKVWCNQSVTSEWAKSSSFASHLSLISTTGQSSEIKTFRIASKIILYNKKTHIGCVVVSWHVKFYILTCKNFKS